MENSNLEKNENKFIIFFKKKQKIFIFLSLIFVTAILIWFGFLNIQKKNNVKLSEKYNLANILIKDEKLKEAKSILNELIKKKNKFYSPAALNLIIENNLEKNQDIILLYFDDILNMRSLDQEKKNLYKLKKAYFLGETDKENLILETLRPLIKSNSIWKKNAIIFLQEYYLSRGQKNKAIEFQELLSQK